MDIFAEIIENGERTGLLGFREDLWSKQTGFDKRLVFKLFGEKLNWRATMDLMLGRSVQETIGARGMPVTSFAINTNDHDQVVYLERSANKWPSMPEHFSFFLMDDGQLKFYRLKQDLISIGQDYSVYDASGPAGRPARRQAVLARRIVGLQGAGGARRQAADVGAQAVRRACWCSTSPAAGTSSSWRRTSRDGSTVAKLQRQEADLYMNPRRVR